MDINEIIILPGTLDKLAQKHNVRRSEVEEVFINQPWIRWAEKGHTPGEDAYAALGRTDGGRYLVVFFLYKKNGDAFVISARAMDQKERCTYERR